MEVVRLSKSLSSVSIAGNLNGIRNGNFNKGSLDGNFNSNGLVDRLFKNRVFNLNILQLKVLYSPLQ